MCHFRARVNHEAGVVREVDSVVSWVALEACTAGHSAPVMVTCTAEHIARVMDTCTAGHSAPVMVTCTAEHSARVMDTCTASIARL